MGQTRVEKIAQRFATGLADGDTVHSGDFLSIRPAHVMTHDNTAAVIPKFEGMGATRMADAGQPVFALDHDIQNDSAENRAKYARIEAFAETHGVAFYPAGRGIGHQIMMEEGFVLPGTFVVGSDSHSNIYGALGALGTPVVRTDAAAIWATGRTWWQVPDVVRVTLLGSLGPGVSAKDVIIALIGTFNRDEVLNCCLEFSGPGVAGLSVEGRMAIANMTTEWGALAGVFPFDEVTRAYLLGRARVMADRGDAHPRLSPELIGRLGGEAITADADAAYVKEIELDLAAVTPHVAGPNEVKTIVSLPEIERRGVRIDKAFLLSCVNGRLEDFVEAAEVLGGRQVAEGVTLYIAAASSDVEEQARQCGAWHTLLKAGAVALPPGCGPCIGLGEGILKDGEVGISATNRNFKGRMGSRDSQVYLASPAVVAASAAAGRIAASGDAEAARDLARSAKCREIPRAARKSATVTILDGFPKRIEGALLFVPKDNMNTDGIYGKEFTYQDGLSPEEMGSKAMLTYDPRFQALARRGDILVGGRNFGSGSSREQAATALKHRGLQMVIAGSFSQTYKRNAFNNGYICIECPALVDELQAAFKNDGALTIRTAWRATVDFTQSRITVACGPRAGQDEEPQASACAAARTDEPSRDGESPRGLKSAARQYAFAPLGEIAQELIVKNGFEAVIRDQLAGST